MKYNKIWARLLLVFIIFLVKSNMGFFVYGQGNNSSLYEVYKSFLSGHPEEIIFIHTDRDVYSPGTEINFKAYLRSSGEESASSDALNIILLNYLGEEIQHLGYPINGNMADGKIFLDPELNAGEYTLKAYTENSLAAASPRLAKRKIMVKDSRIPSLRISLSIPDEVFSPGNISEIHIKMLNQGGKPAKNYSFDYSFSSNGNVFRFGEAETNRKGEATVHFQIPDEEGLSIITAQISADFRGVFHSNSILIPTSNWPSLISFYPEGGKLIEGYETRIAFTARNVLGEPIEVKGVLIDDNDSEIGEISTSIAGLGSFSIVPDIGNPVFVRLSEPFDSGEEFALPEIQDEGVHIQLKQIDDGLILNTEYNYDVDSLMIRVIAEMGGRVVWTDNFVVKGDMEINVPTRNLPGGVMNIILANDEFGLFALRPVFIQRNAKLIEAEAIISDRAFSEKGEVKIRMNYPDVKEGSAILSVALVDEIVSPDCLPNPDIYSTFLLGSAVYDSPFPKYYIADNESFDQDLFDVFMITQLNAKIFWQLSPPVSTDMGESSSEVLKSLLDSENPGAMQQLLSVLRTDQFNERYIMNSGEVFDTFLASNQNELEKLQMIPGQLTEEEIVARLLERGTPIFNIVKVLQPVWSAGELIYFRSPTSISYQPPALIVIDGIVRGSSSTYLKDIDPFSVESVKVYTSIAEILKYGGIDSAGGIIEIVTKKGDVDLGDERSRLPEDIYNPSLYWNPNVQVSSSNETRLDLPFPRLNSNYSIIIQGLDGQGRPVFMKKSGL